MIHPAPSTYAERAYAANDTAEHFDDVLARWAKSISAEDVTQELDGMPADAIALLYQQPDSDEAIGRVIRAVLDSYIRRLAVAETRPLFPLPVDTAEQAVVKAMASRAN